MAPIRASWKLAPLSATLAGALLAAEVFDFGEEVVEELDAGEVHFTGLTQVLDAAEGAQGVVIKLGAEDAVLLILHDGLRGDAGDLGEDLQGVGGLWRG